MGCYLNMHIKVLVELQVMEVSIGFYALYPGAGCCC